MKWTAAPDGAAATLRMQPIDGTIATTRDADNRTSVPNGLNKAGLPVASANFIGMKTGINRGTSITKAAANTAPAAAAVILGKGDPKTVAAPAVIRKDMAASRKGMAVFRMRTRHTEISPGNTAAKTEIIAADDPKVLKAAVVTVRRGDTRTKTRARAKMKGMDAREAGGIAAKTKSLSGRVAAATGTRAIAGGANPLRRARTIPGGSSRREEARGVSLP